MNKETRKFRKQATELKENLIKDICLYLQAPKPNGFKCRPALYIGPRGLKTFVRNHTCAQRVRAILPGYVVTENSRQIEWHAMENMYIEELLAIQKHLDETIKCNNDGKQLRIFDPFWFLIPDKANENLKKVLSETRKHYIESFNQNKDGE